MVAIKITNSGIYLLKLHATAYSHRVHKNHECEFRTCGHSFNFRHNLHPSDFAFIQYSETFSHRIVHFTMKEGKKVNGFVSNKCNHISSIGLALRSVPPKMGINAIRNYQKIIAFQFEFHIGIDMMQYQDRLDVLQCLRHRQFYFISPQCSLLSIGLKASTV